MYAFFIEGPYIYISDILVCKLVRIDLARALKTWLGSAHNEESQLAAPLDWDITEMTEAVNSQDQTSSKRVILCFVCYSSGFSGSGSVVPAMGAVGGSSRFLRAPSV